MFQQFFDKVEHGEFGPDTKLKDWVLDIICDDIRNALTVTHQLLGPDVFALLNMPLIKLSDKM